MTVDWTVDPPIPPRPGGSRPEPDHRRRPSRRGRRRLFAAVGAAVLLAVLAASCAALTPADGRQARRVVRPAPRRTVHPLPIRWGVDRLADPTAMLVDGDDAFVVEPSAVSSIGVADGATRWRVDVKDAEPFVAADNDTVLVGAVDGFEALDRASGVSRWRVTVDDPYDRGRTVGLVATPGGPIAVVTTRHGGVAGIDATTGATRWSATVDGAPRGQLVTDGRTGLVVLEMDHDGRVELHVLDGATGAERWSAALGLMTGLPLVDGPRLVLDTGGISTPGTVIAFDLATGTRHWTARVAGSSEPGEGAIVDGHRVVIVDGLGTVTALDRTTGLRVWSHDLPMPVFHGRPIAIQGVLALRTISGEIHTLDRRSGRHQGVFRINGVGVGLGGGPSGLVFARSDVTQHQIVGLPDRMLTMRTAAITPPIPVPATG